MKIPFVDLHAQYLTIKPEIDAAIQDVITNSTRAAIAAEKGNSSTDRNCDSGTSRVTGTKSVF